MYLLLFMSIHIFRRQRKQGRYFALDLWERNLLTVLEDAGDMTIIKGGWRRGRRSTGSAHRTHEIDVSDFLELFRRRLVEQAK
jgi:hypothetical protein